MTIGQKIKKLRSESDFSQTDLAIKIGVSKQTLYKYENDIITNIPSDKIELLAKYLNSSPSYLMGWTKEDMDEINYKQSVFDAMMNFYGAFGYEKYHIANVYDELNSNGKKELLNYTDYLVSKYSIEDKILKKDNVEQIFAESNGVI